MSSSRRTNTRLDVAVPVLLYFKGSLCRGVARNVSSGGAFVETTHKIPLGTAVRIVFGIGEGGRELAARAEVKHQICLNYVDTTQKTMALLGIGLRFMGFEATLPPDRMDA